MRLLDLFSGAGGCSVGYARSGFTVTGVDNKPHPDYPYELLVRDAVSVLRNKAFLSRFVVVHASPPCPRYSRITPEVSRDSHPDLIGPVRDLLQEWGGTYVIENVPGAPLLSPAVYCARARPADGPTTPGLGLTNGGTMTLPDREPWMDEAICAQIDGDLFFPEKGGSHAAAKRTCLGCPVRAECLEYALARNELWGVWGGKSERERRKLKKAAA